MGAQKLLRGHDASASLRHPQMATDQICQSLWGPYDHLQYTSLKINMGLNSTNKTVETTQATAFVSDKSCKAFIVAMYACRPTSFRLILYFIS